ncbi:MAG: acetolactate synthase small subunit [Candidatus Bathyarchaeota archaeon]|nr:acetolactate synthase small subunit [Candidatus Bathyarchaeota archaeon]MDW8022966.1 acetolactate synthase small subunit [Nitrososphaerota archaeon]MDW8041084.1 acetolactate synthase small subunit [Nitrososphaerota archaeon]
MEPKNTTQEYIVSAIVEHRPGVLFRVSNLFRRRGFNIQSISVGSTERKEFARITITVSGDEKLVEQIVKQLRKLIEVVKVSILDPKNTVVRELALVKVAAPDYKAKADIINYAEIFKGRVVDVSHKSLTIEVTGGPDKIDAFINVLKPYGIKEMARTGITALQRGESQIT